MYNVCVLRRLNKVCFCVKPIVQCLAILYIRYFIYHSQRDQTEKNMEQNFKELVKEICELIKKIFNDSESTYFDIEHIWIPETQISGVKTVNIRTAEQSEKGDVIELQQFNPSSILKGSGEIRCRMPECLTTTARRKPTHSSEKVKQGLFLCEVHRTMLTTLVLQRCAKEGVIVNVANFNHEGFNGALRMIEVLEKAFRCLRKKSSYRYYPYFNPTDSVLAEVFLNTRNFLIIADALLTSDNDTSITFVAPYILLFKRFLAYVNDPKLLHHLLLALQEVTNMVLSFHGIIYAWVFLPNAGAQVGSCVGVALGIAGAMAFGSLSGGVLASTVVGLIAGNLIGSGGYDWYRERGYTQLQKQMVQSYQQFMSEQLMKPVANVPPLYYVPVNADGDLT